MRTPELKGKEWYKNAEGQPEEIMSQVSHNTFSMLLLIIR